MGEGALKKIHDKVLSFKASEALFGISDKYKPIVQMPGEAEETVFDYRYLHSEEQAAKRKYDALFAKGFMDIKVEIQKSIQL